MNNPKKTEEELVSEHINQLAPDVAEIVNYLRQLILSVSDEISERIKWNSPSFYYSGEMSLFDPKTYKRDLIVLNIRKERILLVFPTGASIIDVNEVLEGTYSDGRRLVTLESINDAKAKSESIKNVIQQWLAQVV